jgi:anaerobic dimethyl sulfoxide reductase subunit A
MLTDKKRKESATESKVVVSSCVHDCGGRCVLKLHIENGKIVRIESDNGEEPQLKACLRGRSYRQRVYSPNRLKYPLKRIGERGAGEFQRISWDEALDTVANALKRTKENYGSSAILYQFGAGNGGVQLHGPKPVARLLNMFGGFSYLYGSCSCEGARFADKATYGTYRTGHTRDDFLNSRLIILWGWNPAVSRWSTNTNLQLVKSKEAGVRIVSVDPRYSESAAAYADQWIPIRPGTDTAMLIAMAYVIIKEGLQDQEFLNNYTIGFDKFKEYVNGEEDGVPKTPSWAEPITEVPENIIENLAREYATAKPAALFTGWAPGRSAFGEQFHRAAHVLTAMTGNIGIPGGNPAGHGRLPPYIPFGLLPTGENPVKDKIHNTKIWDAILQGKAGGYPTDIKMLYSTNGNPLNQSLNLNKGIQALRKLEFIVIHEQFMTATAKFADILLPINTHFERMDISRDWIGGALGPTFIYLDKAIDSLYESKSDFEICCELAPRLGIHNYNDKSEEEWLKEFVKGETTGDGGRLKEGVWEGLSDYIPDYDSFKEKKIHKVRIPHVAFQEQIEDPQNHSFLTPSGKIEIYSQQLHKMSNPKIPPIPKYIEHWESHRDPLTKKYPLQLITPHFRRRCHSTFDNIPWLKEVEPQQLWMNSIDAQVRGINNGAMIRIFNDRGEMIITAKVTERIVPGVVSLGQGAWYNPDENGIDKGGNPNVLCKDAFSPGGAFCSNTCLVQVQKV